MVIPDVLRQVKSRWAAFHDIFIVSRKKWSVPEACAVLIYDTSGSEALMPYLERFKTGIVAVRGESINMYCMVFSLLDVDFWRGKLLKAYLDTYIKVDPNR